MGNIQFERLINSETCSERSEGCAMTADTLANCSPAVRVQIALPQWLSCKVLEVIACKAQIGWKQYLRVRNVFPTKYEMTPTKYERTPFAIACFNIGSGSLNKLRIQLENRELTPWDENTKGYTLILVSRGRNPFILFWNLAGC